MSSTTPSLAQESKAQPQTAQAPLPLGWREVVPIHRLPVITKTPVMIIAGAYLSHAEFHVNTVIATMVLASALWTVLYYYNELTDIKLEKQAEVQSGLDTLCLTLMALLVAMGFAVRIGVGVCLLGMAVSQWGYCSPTLRLKRYWQANILLSGTINPILRFAAGAVWGTTEIPWLLLGMYVLLNFGASTRTRTLLRKRDAGLGYTQAPAWMEAVGKTATCLGFSCVVILIVKHALHPIFLLFFLIAAGYAVYAWSGRVTQMGQLRRGWLLFAGLSLFVIAFLFLHK